VQVREIGHVISRLDECGWSALRSDVLLDIGLAVEMRHVRQPTFGGIGDVDEGREDDVLHVCILGSVGDVLAMLELGARGCPGHEIGQGDEEQCMRSLKCLGKGGLRIQVGLETECQHCLDRATWYTWQSD
jgi:hypothetical protein